METGNDPISRLINKGEHPFPPDVEELILRIYRINPEFILGLANTNAIYRLQENPAIARESFIKLLKPRDLGKLETENEEEMEIINSLLKEVKDKIEQCGGKGNDK